MDDKNKNLILATALCLLVIIGWYFLFPPEKQAPSPEPATSTQPLADPTPTAEDPAPETETATATATGTPDSQQPGRNPADEPRVKVDTPNLVGSMSLVGGRIDDISLRKYHTGLDDSSPIVALFEPTGSDAPYYAVHGWAPGGGLTAADVPGPDTEWQVEKGEVLGVDSPVTLVWDNGKGLTFRREISVDRNFMLTITQSVENNSGATASLAPYGLLRRHGKPTELKNFFILHEGMIGVADGKLSEVSYKKMADLPEGAGDIRSETTRVESNGWIGFTDHYWMSTLIPQPGASFRSVARYDPGRDIYQTEAVLPTVSVGDGATETVTTRLFVGAKQWETLREYERDGIADFINSIDWGWFFFLTKPIFWLLHHLHQLIGNMGIAIISLTLIIKALLFPLAYKSYVSMARMKELQPQMQKLKEAAGDDRQKLQQGMMELYKKEKVNPAAGCLPILMQVPIFFSLYKVIFVAFELRHAPFFGPFQDLSAPDPTSIINFFGLLPWGAPEPGTLMATIFIGILPLLLGISMWLQQKLNPAPADPTQQMIMAWMPWVFMFMLGTFASGLVLYWITNNTITFSQQYAIMRLQGYKPNVLGNIRTGFSRKAKAEKK
ncbi:membrane protein insertase YidC [Pontibaca methylaminivorans]|uniref:membrane protein insertase YidC n=1 Tax=Pontibaca methylaminivorans TaxID=515897 RepID=UPI002FDA4177